MKQATINQYLRNEIESAQWVIAGCQNTGHDRSVYVVGVLRATLAGMAGLGDCPLHKSCFDTETTEAVKQLLETIDQQ